MKKTPRETGDEVSSMAASVTTDLKNTKHRKVLVIIGPLDTGEPVVLVSRRVLSKIAASAWGQDQTKGKRKARKR